MNIQIAGHRSSGARIPGSHPGGLLVETVPPEGWESIRDWDDAVAASPRPSVFLLRDWVVTWWRLFGTRLRPLLVRVADADGRTLGIAPMYLEYPKGTGPVVRRLGIIGDRIIGSEYLGLIARAGHETEVARAAVSHLVASGVGWDAVELIGLVDGDPAGEALELELAAGMARARSDREVCSMIHLPGDFDTYLASLGSKFRQSYRQRANKLHRTYEVRTFTTSAVEDLPGQLDHMFEMHQEHWTKLGWSGSFFDPKDRQFYVDAASRLLAEGRLRFWHLEIDGVVRASQFGFAYDGVVHSLQEAYDTNFKGPGIGGLGVILRAAAIKASIEEGMRGYDFLGGEEDFKTRWGTSSHSIRKVHLAAPGIRGRLGWMATIGAHDAWRRAVDGAPPELISRLRVLRAKLHELRAARKHA
jgi:CelD/BcsL family acetyltransferase involved in cellulose biosynthesis